MKSLRVVLIWLLALALPGQAFAAAMSSACLKQVAHGTAATLMSDATAAPCHGDSDPGSAKSKAHQCSACAACGLGMAWIPARWVAPQLELPTGWLPAAPATVTPSENAGIFEPPRSRSA